MFGVATAWLADTLDSACPGVWFPFCRHRARCTIFYPDPEPLMAASIWSSGKRIARPITRSEDDDYGMVQLTDILTCKLPLKEAKKTACASRLQLVVLVQQ